MTQELYHIFMIFISGVGFLLTFGGLFFALVQIKQMQKSREAQLELARRDKTVEMVKYYTESLTKETKRAERIVSSFSEEQCRALYDYIPFVVDRNVKRKICEICPNTNICNKDETKGKELCLESSEYWVKGELLYDLRWRVMRYLNTLESVLLAWQLGIVDQATLKDQFRFLNRKSQKERTLEIYRSIAGNGHSYPAIEMFYQHLSQEDVKEAEKALKEIIK